MTEPAARFFHGTSAEAARQIQESGFRCSYDGATVPELGPGVCCSTTRQDANYYAVRSGGAGGVVLELEIDLGLCTSLQPQDPQLETWQEDGYDSVWVSGGNEVCVRDPARIKVVASHPVLSGRTFLREVDMAWVDPWQDTDRDVGPDRPPSPATMGECEDRLESGRSKMKRWRLLRMICALLGLVAVLLSLSLIKVPAELPGGSETSTVEHVSGHDCVRFVDYDSDGKVVESDYVIGTADFTFMAWLEPRRLEYSMILSRDRAGEPADQFRIAMWNDGRIGISAASSSPAVKYDLPYPSAVDFQGWGSHFTTQLPLEPDRKAFFALARRGPEWAIFLDGKHAMAGGWRRHENASTTDLRFYENRNLRLGTRYPQLPSLLSPSARVVQVSLFLSLARTLACRPRASP